ncbi:MAG: hypothetical protein AVDCRST_MAG52-978, partial [uncultured Blastococcus sp.]
GPLSLHRRPALGIGRRGRRRRRGDRRLGASRKGAPAARRGHPDQRRYPRRPRPDARSDRRAPAVPGQRVRTVDGRGGRRGRRARRGRDPAAHGPHDRGGRPHPRPGRRTLRAGHPDRDPGRRRPRGRAGPAAAVAGLPRAQRPAHRPAVRRAV